MLRSRSRSGFPKSCAPANQRERRAQCALSPGMMFSLKHGNFELKSLFKENCFALPKIVKTLSSWVFASPDLELFKCFIG
jgi:hypothetical protein